MTDGNAERGEVKDGHWYLCAKCRSCGQAVPILEILPDAPISGDGTFTFRDVPCPYCGTKHDYPMRTLQRVQARAGTTELVQ